MTQRDWVTDLADTIAAAKEASRELHGLLKDAKQVRAETLAFMEKSAGVLCLIAIKKQLPEELRSVADQVNKRFDEQTDATVARINGITKDYEATLQRLSLYLDTQGV